ncbi:cytochrome P450 2U1-like [Oppia nitens]|uniref:cytochrome P450 2U1-like n=1 Tax=Oppia nitens TaxID=1686743 RepID=UPI0023DA4AEA|nr:cytochrome P450 2U1-like [Oppia nitens]
MPSYPTLVLNDWPSIQNAIQLALSRNAISQDNFNPDNYTLMEPKEWKEQRFFIKNLLSKVGFAKQEMDRHIVGECRQMCEQMIDNSLGTDVNPRLVFGVCIANSVNPFLFGHHMAYDKQNAQIIYNHMIPDRELTFTDFGAHFAHVFRNLEKYLNFWLPRDWDNYKNFHNKLKAIIKTKINERISEQLIDNPNDYIDAYLLEKTRMNTKINKDNQHLFNDNMLLGNMFAFASASLTGVMHTLEWSCLLLATNPDLQKKLHDEIITVYGINDMDVTYDKKPSMPLLHSFILEVLRYRSCSSLNLRMVSKDTEICNYNIAKGTQVFLNFWAVDNDPNLWDEPQEFRSERFLSADKKFVIKPEYFTPFSYGRRSCPGETSAMMQIFLMLVTILQRYEIKASNKTDTTLEFVMKVSLIPKCEPIVRFYKRQN